MLDKNGKELKTGMIVQTSGAYFKNDNGYWFIIHSPGDPSWCGKDYCMKKIGKKGKISTAKYNLCFWPISIHVNDPWKRAEAKEHNAKYAEIEIIDSIPHSAVAEYFQQEADDMYPALKTEAWNWGEDHPDYLKRKQVQDFYLDLAANIRGKINTNEIK